MRNVQIQITQPYVLAVHRNRGDDTPACGQVLRDWTDPADGVRHTAKFAVVSKRVTCTKNGCR